MGPLWPLPFVHDLELHCRFQCEARWGPGPPSSLRSHIANLAVTVESKDFRVAPQIDSSQGQADRSVLGHLRARCGPFRPHLPPRTCSSHNPTLYRYNLRINIHRLITPFGTNSN